MNDDALTFTLVLTRGPASVARHVTVHVPLDGSPVTVGRAPHCHVVLDPRLVFASQVQCNLYCVTPSASSNQNTPARSSTDTPHTPESRPVPTPRLFISDLCSSNGTFVNRRRVGGTDPVELKDGDTVIFGGMRDVEVGDAIPDDAFAGPELAVWCVDGMTTQDTATADAKDRMASHAFEATPVLLPTSAALDEAERALLQTALQSLRKPAAPAGPSYRTPTPSTRQPVNAGDASTGRPSFSPADVPQALFHGDALEASPGSPPATAAKGPRASATPAARDDRATSAEGSATRRSGTVAARLSLCASTTEAQDAMTVLDLFDIPAQSAPPPATVHFHALRLGGHRFHVPESALVGTCMLAGVTVDGAQTPQKDQRRPGTKHARTHSPAKNQPARKNNKGAKRADEHDTPTAAPAPMTLDAVCEAAPFRLSFTHTHWKWTMDVPRALPEESTSTTDDAHRPVFSALLPITSVESVLVCADRAGVAVELKDGCQLPLVDPRVMAGGPENRWAVFLLEASQVTSIVPDADAKPSTAPTKGKKAAQKGTRGDDVAPVVASVTLTELDFAAWVSSLAAFYSTLKFPQPLYVDAADFDLIYAPPTA